MKQNVIWQRPKLEWMDERKVENEILVEKAKLNCLKVGLHPEIATMYATKIQWRKDVALVKAYEIVFRAWISRDRGRVVWWLVQYPAIWIALYNRSIDLLPMPESCRERTNQIFGRWLNFYIANGNFLFLYWCGLGWFWLPKGFGWLGYDGWFYLHPFHPLRTGRWWWRYTVTVPRERGWRWD